MKRIFLCAERFFPRGDAGANRVLYIAKALQDCGWKPIVVSIGKSEEHYFDGSRNGYYFDGIEYRNIICKSSGIPQKIERFLLNGKKTVSILKQYDLNATDVVYVYSSTAAYTKAVLYYAKRIGTPTVVDVVEWHQPFQFKYGKFDPRYRSFMKCFNKLFVEAGNVIAISEMLKSHFTEKGCSVLKLPIFIEPKESFSYKPEEGKLNLIYPGNPYRKDSLEMMLEALNMLNSEEKRRICLHLTGVTRQLLEQSVPGKEYLLDLNCVRIHGWMEYQELMKLYHSIDFALIGRPDNIVTRANFPSKVPELMNRGIPPIITNVGDISEYLTDGYDSIIMKNCTKESCVAAIRMCLKMGVDEISQFHSNAKSCAKNVFDYRNHAKEISDFLNM